MPTFFLKLGTTALGGLAAHIAMMEDEVVRRRKWLTSAEFIDLLGATNLILGPNSTELAIHIGYRRAGRGCCWREFVLFFPLRSSSPRLPGLTYALANYRKRPPCSTA